MAKPAELEPRPGGVVRPGDILRPVTGGWRPGVKPAVTLGSCVNCLLCWIHCPDSAVDQRGGTFLGFDYAACKGCGVCAEVCPVHAIAMVDEATRTSPSGALEVSGDGGGQHV